MRKGPVLLSVMLVASAALLAPTATADLPKPVKHGYVVNQLTIPTTNDQARALGLDVDKDGELDNQLGMVFATLAGQGLDFQSLVDQSVSSGDLVMLLSVKTTSLRNAKRVKVRLFKGVPQASPDLNGGGTFSVDPAAPSTKLKAKIKDRVLTTKRGNVSVSLPPLYPGLPALRLDLLKGRITAKCNARKCTAGRIGGGISVQQIDQRFIPALGAMARAMVAADCPTTPPDDCPSGTSGDTMLNLFDTNDDKAITDQEVRESSLIQSLLAPDLDLVGNDNVKDSLSFAFGFTAARANINGD